MKNKILVFGASNSKNSTNHEFAKYIVAFKNISDWIS